MLIPSVLRPFVLDGLHAANQGVTGMLSNARDRFFWPGLDAAVRLLRQQCRQCNEQAPSQPAESTIPSPQPRVPFEHAVTDLFHLEGHDFLVYADRFSGWVEVERLSNSTFRQVRQVLLRWFTTYGVPEEIASDGGPPFQSLAYRVFLKTWDVHQRLSSAYYPQSNGRAEAAVKSVKRILLGNINPLTGDLDTDAAAKAIMTHRNTPTQDTGISPSVMLFGKPLRDHLPRLNPKLRPEWESIAKCREEGLARRVLIPEPRTERDLQPLNIGDSVQVQNQTGNYPNKWNNTGVITGVLPNRQYHVVMDGSRRVSLRNRRFLKRISPVSRRHFDGDVTPETPPCDSRAPPDQTPVNSPRTTVDPPPTARVEENTGPLDNETIGTPADEQLTVSVGPSPSPVPPALRRGNRERVPRKLFSASIHGKRHEYHE